MAAPPVTPVAGLASVTPVGGGPVVAAGPIANGGFLTNPASATDQGLSAPESIYVDPTGAAAGTAANGTTFEIPPGSTWSYIPGQTTTTSVNAPSPSHKFSNIVF